MTPYENDTAGWRAKWVLLGLLIAMALVVKLCA